MLCHDFERDLWLTLGAKAAEAHAPISLENTGRGSQQEEQTIHQLPAEVSPFRAGLPARAGVWICDAGVSSSPKVPQSRDAPGMSSPPADSHLVRDMATAAAPGQSLQTPN